LGIYRRATPECSAWFEGSRGSWRPAAALRAGASVGDPSRIVHISAVAVREVTIKTGLGRLALPLDRLEATIAAAGFTVLPVTAAHALKVRHLPPLHRDRFERLVIAQARHEGITLVTCDAAIRRYPVATLWDWLKATSVQWPFEPGVEPGPGIGPKLFQ
jgi:PIN domain nuclease of toxin-antitoxin system